MCGITGIIGSSAKDATLLNAMAHTIHHRGPDHTGIMREARVALAMTRLSIIDIAGGVQPMHSSDGRISLVFNGEIYNFRELRAELEPLIEFKTRSDTEVILNGYCIWGKDVFSRLNGMFAVALLDRSLHLMLLVRDPIGVKPLYFYRSQDSIYFSSEIKTFTQLGLANQANSSALYNFLAADYVFNPHTAIKDVVQVSPGVILEIAYDNLSMSDSCYRLPGVDIATGNRKKSVLTKEGTIETIRGELENAVLRQTVADVPYGLLLSSGLDSMAILAVLHKHNLTDHLKTYTLFFPDSASYSEDKPISQLASRWGFESVLIPLESKDVVEHWEDICTTFDNLEMLPTCMAIYFASQVAGKDMRVLLSGNGGDELFLGYPTYRATQIVRQLSMLGGMLGALLPVIGKAIHPSDSYLTIGEKIQRFCLGFSEVPELAHVQWRYVFTINEMRRLLHADYLRLTANEVYRNQLIHFEEAKKYGFTGIDADSWADVRSWLVDSGLSMWDKAGMSASTEIRVPLLDLDLADCLLALSGEIRSGGKVGSKRFLKKILEDIVPHDILSLPKHGFQLPISAWLRGELGVLLKQLTSELPQNVFNKREIERLWDEFENRRGNHALKLWTLGVLAGWARAHKVVW
ncbi:asparagine synthase (glutamine-hydrolyzing) [Sulfuriferula sp. GW1]|uniref:asparagine synthase (glutamine-hydrolyzing) n=1 Tax=Sulfuriferula sp. GW1 TaxID=3345111 RepID=UPI0039AFBA69